MLRITKYGESILKTKGKLIEVFDNPLVDLADEMVDTMYEAHGIGLAAQQIDQAIMLCVIDVDPGEYELEFDYLLDGKKPPIDLIMPMALVNPLITEFSGEKIEEEEGCLSFPDIRGDVERSIGIEIKFQDLEGEFHKLKCDGLFARCIQHEVDHLNGVLFIDNMTAKGLSPIKADIRKLKKQTLKSQKQ